MTDVTDLGEIIVVGQGRRRDGTSPSGGSGAGGGGNNDIGAPEQDEVDPGDFTPDDEQDPCRDPAQALERNINAAAAEAAKEFDRLGRAAGENGINDRERGAFLYRRPDGRIGFGPVPIAEGVRFDQGGESVGGGLGDIDPSTVVGYIHSHPAGQHRPSGQSPRQGLEGGDIGFFTNYLVPLMSGSRVTPRIYIVAQNQLGAGQTPYNQINVYNASNIQSAVEAFTDGPEVNPESTPCPGS